MDTQDPLNQPRYQLTRSQRGLDNEKGDVRLSRQEGSMRCHLGSAQYWDWPACGGIMHSYKMTFSVVWQAGLHRLD